MVHTYSLKKDGATQLSPHFKVREFAEPGNDNILIDDTLIDQLEALYARLDCTKIIITSGYRTDAKASRHAEVCDEKMKREAGVFATGLQGKCTIFDTKEE